MKTIEEDFQAMQKAWETFIVKAETFRSKLEKQAAAAAAPRPSIAVIQKTVADFYSLPHEAMTSASRVIRYSHPRQIAMRLARELTRHTWEEIGGTFGGRDHGTVMHAFEAVAKRAETEPEFNAQLETLRASCLEKVRTINEPLLQIGRRK